MTSSMKMAGINFVALDAIWNLLEGEPDEERPSLTRKIASSRCNLDASLSM